MNPLLPTQFFTPDAEARVMPDGRLYLYGSNDLSGCADYCSKEYHVYVTDDDKMEHWTDCGVSFRNTADHPGLPWSPDTVLFAPDAIERDGKTYLYMCDCLGHEGVAVSDRPEGPFHSAQPIVGADGDGIDPSVFIDDDGQAYYFWGQISLRGAKLNPDMTSLDLSTLRHGILTEQEHGFHEGSSIRKHGGKYYLIYTDTTRGRATCMSYAVADAPLGPYTRGGVIVDNTFCDPGTWNNHGSICQWRGQWYIFYHRASQNSFTSRRVCVEPIHFNPDGSIDEVMMTSQGASDPLDAFHWIDAAVACRLRGGWFIAPQPEGREMLTCEEGKHEGWAEYRYLNFHQPASGWTLRARGKGAVSVMTTQNRILGSIDVSADAFTELHGALTPGLTGTLPVWLNLKGEHLELDAFRFDK